jgi:glycosyltransferase involved in cell wall biosynthesis
MIKPGVSVVICTFNGALLLPETLRHLSGQQLPPDFIWEVIVIDNASTSKTVSVLQEESRKWACAAPLRLYQQPRPGLTYARELAIQKARFEFILFCDDDNWLSPNYIHLAWQRMLQRPAIGMLGGCGELVFEAPPPQWATELAIFASGPQAQVSGKVRGNTVHGAGCMMRKSAYQTIVRAGFKPMLTDRKAGLLSAGGDFEICYAIALAGYTIWYDERLRFKHFMPESRIHWNYYVRLIREGMQSFDVLIPYRIRVNHRSTSLFSFHLLLAGILLSYVLKLIPILFSSLYVSTASEAAQAKQLKIISLKAKIRAFGAYPKMKLNFLKILRLEKKGKLLLLQDMSGRYPDKKVAERAL